MPTVIDAFIVTLAIDSKGVAKGAADADKATEKIQKDATKREKEIQKGKDDAVKKEKQASEKRTKEIELENKKSAESFGKIKNEVLALGAAIVGALGIKSFVSNVTRSDIAVGQLAKNLGISAEALAAWQSIAKNYGSSPEDMNATFRTLQNITQEYQKFGRSSDNVAKALSQLHVDPSIFMDTTRTVEQNLRTIFEALLKVDRQSAQTWGKHLGFSEQTIDVVFRTKGQLDELIETYKKINNLNDDSVAKLTALGLKYDELATKAEGAGRRVLNAWSGPLTKAMDFTEFALGYDFGSSNERTLGTDIHEYFNEGEGRDLFGKDRRPFSRFGLLRDLGSVALSTANIGMRTKTGKIEGIPEKSESPARPAGIRGAPASGIGIHGTPSWILDRVGEAENAGGKDIEGPVIPRRKERAQGPYQFLPSTKKMLIEKYGYKNFNEHDYAQSRDAADFYLQVLAAENRSMAAALAAYHGEKGFDGKPQSSYVSSILGGSGTDKQFMNTSNMTSTSSQVIQGPFTINIRADEGARIARELEAELKLYAYAGQANSAVR